VDVGVMMEIMLEARIELRDVTFGYDRARSTLDVPALSLGAGLTLVLGANGSGKSTLLRLIAGVEPPRTGTVTVGSYDLWRNEVAARRLLAYVPESPELTPYTTLVDMMVLIAALRGASDASIVAAFDRVGLFELGGRTIRELSMGQRRRAMLATALVGEPSVVILDEPLETLDLEMREFVREWVGELRARGAAVLVATHDVAAFAPFTDRVVLVREGRVTCEDVSPESSVEERMELFRRMRMEGPATRPHLAASCREARVVLTTENVRDVTSIRRHFRGFRFVAPDGVAGARDATLDATRR
jgi:ABC-2 type transport system ATP-binding protein